MIAVFTYGTLQIPEVMRAVTGKNFAGQKARLENFSRHKLNGRSYPGIRPQSGAFTEGLLYTGVDAASLAQLDRFEDDFYRRQTLIVRSMDGVARAAEVYTVSEECLGLLLPESWDLEEFRKQSLAQFLRTSESLGGT